MLYFFIFICSSFYGIAPRQSSLIGEDPLYTDHDPIAVIELASKGTKGYTMSSTRLASSLSMMGDSMGKNF